jgi:hypothetical protein
MTTLPDVCTEPRDDGTVVLVASRRARKLLNKHFQHRPCWARVKAAHESGGLRARVASRDVAKRASDSR